MEFGFLDVLNIGVLKYCIFGNFDFWMWNFGSLEFWNIGIFEYRRWYAMSDFWNIEIYNLGFFDFGVSEFWIIKI